MVHASAAVTEQRTEVADRLDEALRFLRRFVVFPGEHHAAAVALWAAHTHAMDAFETTPYLGITSPQRGSGKTRLMELLEELCRGAWRVAEPSPAVLFRKIEAERPTLLLDEMDGVFHAGSSGSESAQAIRAVLNAGNRRGTVVPRAANFGKDLVDFHVFCPKALAGLRGLPDTLADRSIPVPMVRRRRADRIERFRPRDHVPEARELGRRLGEAVGAYADAMGRYRAPGSLGPLTDRQLEAWEPLLAVAEAAGGGWPERAREAAVEIHGSRDENTDDLPTEVLLLQHIRAAFDGDEGGDRILTEHLVSNLRERDDGPWARILDSRFDEDGLKAAQALASMLRPYGVRSRQVRYAGARARGYVRADFGDAWARYLTEEAGDGPRS